MKTPIFSIFNCFLFLTSTNFVLSNEHFKLDSQVSIRNITDGKFKTLEEVKKELSLEGTPGILAEFLEVSKRNYSGTFNIATLPENLYKNRYLETYSLDQSRVVLSRENSSSDFINANYVDGYQQKNEFIATQGPLQNTVQDFWWMIWQEKALVIAMLTEFYDFGFEKCFPYWKVNEGEKVVYGDLEIKTVSVIKDEGYSTTMIEITNLKTNETRTLTHFQVTSWRDYDVPPSPKVIWKFAEKLKEKQTEMQNDLDKLSTENQINPPIVVHCSAGIGRTGTLITIMNSMTRFKETETFNIKGTIETMRYQRAYVVQVPSQYLFCYQVVASYAEELLQQTINVKSFGVIKLLNFNLIFILSFLMKVF